MGSPSLRGAPSTATSRTGHLPFAGCRDVTQHSNPWLERDVELPVRLVHVDSLDDCGIYFGTTGGQVYASADAGDNWSAIVRDLPPVLSVEVQTLT